MQLNPRPGDRVVALTGHLAPIAASAIDRRRCVVEGRGERPSLHRQVPPEDQRIDPDRW